MSEKQTERQRQTVCEREKDGEREQCEYKTHENNLKLHKTETKYHSLLKIE